MKKVHLLSHFILSAAEGFPRSILWIISYFVLSGVEGSAQNVGIGIANPTRAKLEVFGVAGSGATSAVFGSDGIGISLQRNWPTIGFNQYRDVVTPGSQGKYMANGFAAIQYFDQTTGAMAFDMFQNGTANNFTPLGNRGITILTSGNVGIRSGGSNTASLYVRKENNFDGAAIFGGTQHGSYFNYSNSENTHIRAGKDGGSVFVNDIPQGKVLLCGGSGRVGINDFSPTHTLSVNQVGGTGIKLLNPDWGNLYWELRNEPANTDPTDPESVLMLRYNGRPNPIMGWFEPDDGSYNSNSDIRLKENIQTLEPVLERLLKLRPTRYHMKERNPETQQSIGFIAQEAKLLFPELVSIIIKPSSSDPNALSDHHGIHYAGFNVIAIKAIQEQQEVIAAQQKQIDELKRIVSELLQARK